MKFFTTIITVLVLALLLSFIVALPVMWLWNWALVPAVGAINSISFLHAWGISLLFSLLFKGDISTNTN